MSLDVSSLNPWVTMWATATQELPNQKCIYNEHCVSEEQTFYMWFHWDWRLIFSVTNCIRYLLLHNTLSQNLEVQSILIISYVNNLGMG